VEVGLLMLVGGVATGVFGSLLGLGGGVLIVPLLTLAFGLDLREAVGVSLVCVIVTSGASASVYLQRNVANLRLGMLLELFTATGAVVGGAIAFLLGRTDDRRPVRGAPHLCRPHDARPRSRRHGRGTGAGRDRTRHRRERLGRGPATDRRADGNRSTVGAGLSSPQSPDRRRWQACSPGSSRPCSGSAAESYKVPVMHLVMGVPLRVSTATSNLMIGITASTSAIVYLIRGGIDPYVAGPTVVGVFLGATLGSRTAHRVDLRLLRFLFVAVLLYTAFEMARRALGIA